MRVRYLFDVKSNRFLCEQLHRRWRRAVGKSTYANTFDSQIYFGSSRCDGSDVPSLQDEKQMLWRGEHGGFSRTRGLCKFGHVLRYVLSVNAAFGIDIEAPVNFDPYFGFEGDNVDAACEFSEVGSFFTDDFNRHMADAGLRLSGDCEDLSSDEAFDVTTEFDAARPDVSADLVQMCSPITNVTEHEFTDDYVQLDVRRFGNIQQFRFSVEFRDICLAKFHHFTRSAVPRPFILDDKSRQVTPLDLKERMFDMPGELPAEMSLEFRFWLCAWWRTLYGTTYSLMQYLSFGRFSKKFKDCFRVASKIGPAEFHFMFPEYFLSVNDVIHSLDWNSYNNFEDLYLRTHENSCVNVS